LTSKIYNTMKKNRFYIWIVILIITNISALNAQDINWNEVDQGKKHFVNINIGVDYSTYYGLQYSYVLCKDAPIMIDAEFNMPFGNKFMDDWYLRTGLRTRLWNSNNMYWTARASFITRRYESNVGRLVNLGADLTTLFGYKKSWWGIAAEVGYDRSISTHIVNGEITKEFYPEATDGWYNTAGGNFKFGIQASASVKSMDIFLHIGRAFGQDFKDNPMLPAYAKIGISK